MASQPPRRIEVGENVVVDQRTWPGINKQGGNGRVTAVYEEVDDDTGEPTYFYDVRYIFNGGDRRVEEGG